MLSLHLFCILCYHTMKRWNDQISMNNKLTSPQHNSNWCHRLLNDLLIGFLNGFLIMLHCMTSQKSVFGTFNISWFFQYFLTKPFYTLKQTLYLHLMFYLYKITTYSNYYVYITIFYLIQCKQNILFCLWPIYAQIC